MKSIFSAQAPSNIAIIKYMGKKDPSSNLPENGSLSVTLEDLCTLAELEEVPQGAGIQWIPEKPACALSWKPKNGSISIHPEVPVLSPEAVGKTTRHVQRVFDSCRDLLPSFGLEVRDLSSVGFVLRTANTFPQASGIASSASAFAAVTLASAFASAANPVAFTEALGAPHSEDANFKHALAALSRRGSGSSCRSFEGPWVEWEDDRAFRHSAQLPKLAHFVIVVSEQPKAVSSSQAHLLVKGSPLWAGRLDRVNARLRELRIALRSESASSALSQIARISWSEAWEMHSLFHTCAAPFTYWQPGTVEVLHGLSSWVLGDYPPIVTLDAGPNVHVLVEEAKREEWRSRLHHLFSDGSVLRILEDGEGRGARLLMRGLSHGSAIGENI